MIMRRRQPEDLHGIVTLVVESNAYYAAHAPDLFAPVEEEGLGEWLAGDEEWLADPANLALVAELDSEVAGYLEASIRLPSASARFSGNRDLREPHLFVNAVVTAERCKRRGVGTAVVEAAESWAREKGVRPALCDTFLGSRQSLPFWEERMGYKRRSVRLRKQL